MYVKILHAPAISLVIHEYYEHCGCAGVSAVILCILASFPGPTSQTIGKAGGGPGTFWHVTVVKLR